MTDAELRKKEDLFVRIALDNKLVSKWHIKKATDEQERREKEEGVRPSLGSVLLGLGYLTDRQFQSVENAQRYREQRDYDKRIGRQVLRMSLLDQARVEECLESQKQEYTKSGTVKGLLQVFQEKGLLTSAQAAEIVRAIEQRDKARGASGARPSLGGSGPVAIGGKKTNGSDEELTPLADHKPELVAEPTDAGEDELAELRDLETAPDPERTTVGEKKAPGDDDLAGLDDLDEGPKPSATAKAAEDEDEFAALDEVAGGEAQEGDEAEDDEAEGDEAEDDEAEDDEAEDDEAEDDEAEDDEAEDDEAEDDEAEAEDDDDEADAEDEDELASELEELPDGSEVELDQGDLETIDELESGSDEGEADGVWAADAFDDRPLAKRADDPSKTPSGPVAAASPPPAPKAPTRPGASRPELAAPAAKASSPPAAKSSAKSSGTRPAAKASAHEATAIPGGEVLDDSGLAARSAHEIPGGEVLEDSATASASHGLGDAAPVSRGGPAREQLEASTRGLESFLKKVADEKPAAPPKKAPAPRPEPSPARTQSTRTAGPQAATLAASPEAPSATRTADSEPAPPTPDAVALASTGPAPEPPAGAPANRKPPLDLEDPRVRKAFERAMEAAWRVFLDELRGS